MGRALRAGLGGYVLHVLNRANRRPALFQKDDDDASFERVLDEALDHVPGLRLLSYCLMPNHGTWSFGRQPMVNSLTSRRRLALVEPAETAAGGALTTRASELVAAC
jgi:hypothetical protein